MIIEVPKGSRSKYKFDDEIGLFRITMALPFGMSFPYDFGFAPGTKAADGDPLDVLVLMDVPSFPGCVINARIAGVIEAEQTEDGKTTRNDRIVAIEADCREFHYAKAISDIDKKIIDELEQFFIQYNKLDGRKFKLLGCKGPRAANKLIQSNSIRKPARKQK